MYAYLLFDLDGTLTESAPGIINSVKYALSRFGITETNEHKLLRFVGPPLTDSFSRYYGFSAEDALCAVKYYREYFTAGGMLENAVYPGIPELLKGMKERGAKLLVATSKPIEFTVRILKHFGLYDFFDFVAGASMDESRSRKADVIAYCLEQYRAMDAAFRKEDAVMIGDRREDILGGKVNGLKTLGVLYGYGSLKEFEEAGADELAESVADLFEKLSH